MKTQNKKKIIVSTLALAMGAALAGSISGSVAWYQYSTRAAAQITGTSAGTIGELQIQGRQILATPASWSNGGDDNKVNLGTAQYKPMSYGLFDADDDSEAEDHYFHAPVYQTAESVEYDLDNDTLPYVDYELQFKFEHRGTNAGQLEKNVFLTYFAIEKARNATVDFSDAVRVELLDKNENRLHLLSKESEHEIATKGELDLNGNNKVDTDLWDCTDVEAKAAEAGEALAANAAGEAGVDYYTREPSTAGKGYLNDGEYAYTKVDEIPATHEADKYYPIDSEKVGVDGGKKITYVNKEGKAESYKTDKHADVLVSDGYNAYNIEATDNGKELLTTKTSGWSDSLIVRIWLEGWEILGSDANASWLESYIGQNFNINMQFACSAVEQ